MMHSPSSPFSLQPHLVNDWVNLIPLKPADFEALYAVASDPAIWAMHPNKNRFERPVFENFFQGALESGGAFMILDPASGNCLGSTRFYHYNPTENSVFIGYTFLATRCWGKGYNLAIKKLMLHYIFQWVSVVYFHVGAENYRSQKAMQKLGALKINEIMVAYHGEPDRANFTYEIKKTSFSI